MEIGCTQGLRKSREGGDINGDKDPHMYLTVIKSLDLPTILDWKGVTQKHIVINNTTLNSAYTTALSAFSQYVKKLNCDVRRIWP